MTNLACLQPALADQTFTTAKSAGDVAGRAAAVMYHSLERNITPVGGASELCDEGAVNPEIAAITQHQDPASPEAAGNKQIVLDLAAQLKAIGADPNLTIQTGSFPAGTVGDPAGDGFTCDVQEDLAGCIFIRMLVADATEEEIAADLAGGIVATKDVVVAKGAAVGLIHSRSLHRLSKARPTRKPAFTFLATRLLPRTPNATTAQKALAAAIAVGPADANSTANVASGQGLVATICLTSVRQTNQVSAGPGSSSTPLVEADGIAA